MVAVGHIQFPGGRVAGTGVVTFAVERHEKLVPSGRKDIDIPAVRYGNADLAGLIDIVGLDVLMVRTASTISPSTF